jgi:soluble lytic murein transglycosylase-like protein
MIEADSPVMRSEQPVHPLRRRRIVFKNTTESEETPTLANWQLAPDTAASEGVAASALFSDSAEMQDADPAGAGDESPTLLLPNRANVIDEIVIANVNLGELGQVTLTPGASTTLQVTLFNNGEDSATFDLTLAGSILLDWCRPHEQSLRLDPGDGGVLEVVIAPPRLAAALAGDYLMEIQVSASQYPGRRTSLALPVTILPFYELSVGKSNPRRLESTPTQRDGSFVVPIVNQSNAPVEISLHGINGARPLHYAFFGQLQGSQRRLRRFQLAPGHAYLLHVSVRPTRRMWFGSAPQMQPIGVMLSVAQQPQNVYTAHALLVETPLFGPWTAVALSALFALIVLCVGMFATLGLTLALRTGAPAVGERIVASAAPASALPAPIVIVLNSEAKQSAASPNVSAPFAPGQANTNAGTGRTFPIAPPPVNATPSIGGVETLDPNLPRISAGDVSAPDASQYREATLSAAAQSVDVNSSTDSPPSAHAPALLPPPQASNQRPLTYGQMFQEIGSRYDLNWRMLAAQAYIESGFDPLALGNNSDMGLMQVLPQTWKEWSPVVGVNDPFDSYDNTLVAAAYLDHLRTKLGERGYPQQEWMLVAYNWGIDHTFDFLAAGGVWETLLPERRRYAEEILRVAATIP